MGTSPCCTGSTPHRRGRGGERTDQARGNGSGPSSTTSRLGGGENLLTLHHTLSSHLHNEGIRLKFPSELHCSVTLSHMATANSAN